MSHFTTMSNIRLELWCYCEKYKWKIHWMSIIKERSFQPLSNLLAPMNHPRLLFTKKAKSAFHFSTGWIQFVKSLPDALELHQRHLWLLCWLEDERKLSSAMWWDEGPTPSRFAVSLALRLSEPRSTSRSRRALGGSQSHLLLQVPRTSPQVGSVALEM